jgi:hypothetical protein
MVSTDPAIGAISPPAKPTTTPLVFHIDITKKTTPLEIKKV